MCACVCARVYVGMCVHCVCVCVCVCVCPSSPLSMLTRSHNELTDMNFTARKTTHTHAQRTHNHKHTCTHSLQLRVDHSYKHSILGIGQNHAFIGIYGVHTVFLAGKSPYIRSYMVQIYGSGQPYSICICLQP